MKPNELKYPFKNGDYQIVLQEDVLFIPERITGVPIYPQVSFFKNEQPIHVEYCSGNGAWVIAKALENPLINWIAVEKKFERVRKIWKRGRKLGLQNLFIICGEAEFSTSIFLKSESIESIFINFPDPWPKRKHWKNRIINQDFFSQVNRILKSKGQMVFVTDDLDYSSVMIKETFQSEKFNSAFSAPFYSTDMPGYGTSFFEDLWRSRGKEIRYHIFNKK